MRGAIFVAMGLLLCCSAQAADPAADKVLDCMRANIPQSLRIQDFEIVATDRGQGQRTLRGRFYGKSDKGMVRSTVKILAPPDLANAAYLMREGKSSDEMFVYLPALNRVRRITGNNADSPLFGTDLSYADIKQINNAFSGGAVKFEKNEALDGRDAQVLSMVPRADAQSRYSLVRGWIDAKTCVVLKVEFTEGTAIRKRLTIDAKEIKQDGKRWYPARAQMSDLKLGTQTTLKVTGVTTDPKLSDALFGPTTFYVGG